MKVSSERGAAALRVLRLVVRGLVTLWAGFWAWFVVMVTFGEPPAPPWWIPVAWLGSLAALVWLCWKRPTLGGLALAAAGTWSATYFDHPDARALLASPTIVLGVACLALGFGTRHVARHMASAVLLCSCLTLVACLAPQDPADLPYRTSSILRHEDGRMRRAFLVEETEIAGFPCQRWIWWYEDGRIDNLELARDLAVQGHDFPAGTRLFFDQEGRLAHAWLSNDAVLDGCPCRGGMKIDTAFHPNGRVRAFFPRRAIEIDGLLCDASLFHPIYLHPDGRLEQCKLARSVMLDGRSFEKGVVLTLDESGRARR